MMLKFPLQFGTPLPNAEDIASFERESDILLPEPYKKFLGSYNGGFFLDGVVGLDVDDRFVQVFNFIPLDTDPDSGLRSVVHAIARDGWLYPRGYLPIAYADGDEKICITDSRLGGEMFLARTSYDELEEPYKVDLSFLAESFDDLLARLRHVERVILPLVELAGRGDEACLLNYLQQGGSVDAISEEGETLICEAIGHLNVPMVKAFIKHGASLKATMHAAIRVRSLELLDILIMAGASPFDLDRFGRPVSSELGGTALPGEDGRINRMLEEKFILAVKRSQL